MEKTLNVAGLTPLTTIDFPGRLAAVVYCRGCNLRCRYCHNADLQDTTPSRNDMNWQDVRNFLETRKRKLDGVVFTGGEPLIQGALGNAMRDVRAMGFEVALHTAGTAPERLAKVLPLVDWVGYDVKTMFEQYEIVTRIPGSGRKARRGLEMLLASGVDYEVRTTADPELIPYDVLLEMAREIADMGVKTFRLQESSFSRFDYEEKTEMELAKIFEDFDIRRDPLKSRSAA
jgi:pyruvate formate lyase activating enzyme